MQCFNVPTFQRLSKDGMLISVGTVTGHSPIFHSFPLVSPDVEDQTTERSHISCKTNYHVLTRPRSNDRSQRGLTGQTYLAPAVWSGLLTWTSVSVFPFGYTLLYSSFAILTEESRRLVWNLSGQELNILKDFQAEIQTLLHYFEARPLHQTVCFKSGC